MALLVRRAFRHLSRVHDVLFRRTLLEREITIFDDDVFLTSYPRSGNTWTRFLVGNFVNPNEPVTFLNVERLVPDMYKTADRACSKATSPSTPATAALSTSCATRATWLFPTITGR